MSGKSKKNILSKEDAEWLRDHTEMDHYCEPSKKTKNNIIHHSYFYLNL